LRHDEQFWAVGRHLRTLSPHSSDGWLWQAASVCSQTLRLRSDYGRAHLASMKALRVLVVEDDCLIAMLLAELLAGMGHEVCTTAGTEADAIAAAIRDRPDLMIVDAGLGRGSGVAAVEKILQVAPVAHVFMSGDARKVQALRPDAVVVRKPFREAELVRAIEIAVGTAATT
jgi:CheY-like chemotaxis protein